MTRTRRAGQAQAQQAMVDARKRCACAALMSPSPSPPSPDPMHMSTKMAMQSWAPASVESSWIPATAVRYGIQLGLLHVAFIISVKQRSIHAVGRAGMAVGMDDLPDSALQLIAQHVTCFPLRCATLLHSLHSHVPNVDMCL